MRHEARLGQRLRTRLLWMAPMILGMLSLARVEASAATTTCLDMTATITGTSASERIEGTSGDDVIA